MEQINYTNLGTTIKQLQCLNYFSLEEGQNMHSVVELTGILDSESDEYITNNIKNEMIRVFVKDTNETLFQGVVHNASICMEGGIRYLSVRAVSCTYLLDVKLKSRSFQDKTMEYRKLFKDIAKEYSGGDCIDMCTNGKKLEQIWVQYNETDWEFLKRMASHFNQALYPDAHFGSPKFFVGKRRGTNRGKLGDYEYKIQKNIQSYMEQKSNTIGQLDETDRMRYQIRTKYVYDIGDEVTFRNQTLYIYHKKLTMERGLLECVYELCNEKGFLCDFQYNEKIAGQSIKGKVLKLEKEKVKVQLEIDERQDAQKAWPFTYETVYAAEGFSGWYCMPEVGDTVSIYFPQNLESMAVGMDSLRVNPKGGDKISNPDVKYFSTPHGKEIMFTPDMIQITCNANGKSVIISLNESNGVAITTSENIQFKSGKDIAMSAGGSIYVSAGEEIALRCKTGEIKMKEKVDIKGEEVRVN